MAATIAEAVSEPIVAAATASVSSPIEMEDVKPTTEPVAKPTEALTPPTSEEMNHGEVKEEPEESELSDLDLDDDEEEIEPDHYWDGGRIPVFKPTMDQFRSFKKFVDKIDKYGMKSGIVKVIPPKEWRDSLHNLDEYVKRIKIKNPITQEFNGTQGIYTQQNVEKQRSYNLPEWKALTEETQHQPPAKRGERRRNQEKVVRGAAAAARNRASTVQPSDGDDSPKPKRKPGRPFRRKGAVTEPEADDGTDSPSSKPVKSEKKPRTRPSKSGGVGQAKSVTSRRLNNTAEAVDYVDEEAFKDFRYNIEHLDGYTPERCAELETHYWKSLGFNQPMYAADMPGSLFDDSTTSWNVAKLENLLDVLGTKVPGVNTAYLYMGMWKATFAWHLEDVDLYSINYIHFGAPKQWYSISQEDARKFEKAMKTVWPVDAKNCDQFLRHKTYLISPDVLQKQYGVKVNKLVHYEGEFVITFPYGYHSGYNIGYNCAESVNFATESWLEYGKIARKCNCEVDNVWVDVFEIERKLRGEPTPEYIEETDDDSDLDDEDGHLPSPPASVKGKTLTKKRKRGVKPTDVKKKKIRIKIRVPTREPCVMCPNDNPWEPLLPTDNGKKAHRSCAIYTPETWIAKEGGSEIVCGVSTIDRARLDLKCNFCRSKRGACFQCSSKKCTRAFHATCALAAGVQVDGGMVPTFGEDGTEYFEEGFDFRCKYHRPKMPKNLNVDSLENSKRVLNFAKELNKNDVIQAQLIGAEVFAGLVIENRPSEQSVLVEVLPDGERIEIEWKWLCVLDPEDSLRPKPTANAIPMPEGMNKKAVSLSNRQDGVPTQDEQFHDIPGFKWQEFYNIDMPPPGYMSVKLQLPNKLQVDLDSPDPIYHYLPAKSTESRPSFTDKPESGEIAPRANFLDRVQPKPVPRQPVQRQAIPQSQSIQPLQKLQHHIPPGTMYNYKPYMYKPKESSKANSMWGVDQQALSNQRTFLADCNTQQRPTYAPNHNTPRLGHQSGETSRTGTPLRPFPTDHYYSTKILPAAYHGEHSVFREAARRESQGAQTMPRPPSSLQGAASFSPSRETQEHAGKSWNRDGSIVPSVAQASQPVSQIPGNASQTYGQSTSDYASSAPSYQSPYAAASKSATLQSTTSARKMITEPVVDPAYSENLKLYPYLYQRFQQRATNYASPYPKYDTSKPASGRPQSHQSNGGDQSRSFHTPKTSISSNTDAIARSNPQWTPPSQLWDLAGYGKPECVSSKEHATFTPRQLAPMQSSSQDLQRQLQSFPSTASRDGAQARLLRDQGHSSYPQQTPHGHPPIPQHDEQRHWASPKAPISSPLSDHHSTVGILGTVLHNHTPGNGSAPWSTPNPSANNRPPTGGYGYGPMMPHSSGRDSWRNS